MQPPFCPEASGAGQGAVFLPEAADRGLAGAKGLRLGIVSAHHHDTAVVVIVAYPALDQPADAAILHRDVACGADQIALPQPALRHGPVVVVKSDMNPFELGFLEPARADHPNGESVAD